MIFPVFQESIVFTIQTVSKVYKRIVMGERCIEILMCVSKHLSQFVKVCVGLPSLQEVNVYFYETQFIFSFIINS